MKSKILVLCQYFYPEKISSGVLPYELSSRLAKKFQCVTALVGYPKEYIEGKLKVPYIEKLDGVNIRRIRYIQANRTGKVGRIINMVSFGVAVMFKPFQFYKCDTIICFTNPPILPMISAIYAKLFNKKLITVIYDLYPDSPIKLGVMQKENIVCKMFEKINRFVFAASNKVVVLSEEMKKYLMMNKGLENKKVKVIHNWYDDLYSDVSYEVSLPIRIIYGGNMGTAQDMDTIIKMVRLLKSDRRFEFVFVGHGNKKADIEKVVRDEKIENCRFYDFLPKNDYEKLLETSHIAILSLEKEVCGIGSPSKYYSYLALKKPIIAILPEECEIADDIKKYRIGIHVLNGEFENLSKKLISLCESQEELYSMSERAYKLFKEKYTLEKAVEKYEHLIKEI